MKSFITALAGLVLLSAVFVSSTIAGSGAPSGGSGGGGTGATTLNHALPGTSTLACTATTASTTTQPIWDWYGPGTMTASVTYTLPSSGCTENDVIGIRLIQGAGSFTETVNTASAGGIISAGCAAIGAGAGSIRDHYFQWSSIPATWSETCGYPIVKLAIAAGGTNSTIGPEGPTLSVSGALGGLTSTAGATLLQACLKANNAGKFTDLRIVNDLNGATCTTAPTYNVRDNTASTTGTAKAGSTTAGSVNQAQTLAFSAGDEICLVRTVNGGTCTAPIFSVTAQTLGQ